MSTPSSPLGQSSPLVQSSSLVHCDQASRTFGRGTSAVVAVHAATCVVEAGARIAVVGPSGSGKSTLLHLLGGLDTPTSGQVTWPAWGRPPRGHGDDVATVFQGASLMPDLDVAENVALPLLLQGVDPTVARRQALDCLTLLDIAALADKLPEELSGGQSQRVSVARVVATRPRLILADEPTGQLDQATGQHVIDVLLHAADQLGAGVVVSTHDPRVAARLDHRWRMHEGRLDVRLTAPAGTRSTTS